ncbi:MAG: S41 family peptidase [Bacteroidales bacterium]|jgi:carboxyl-terminal processing protease|nr:S41 family peptidase [Bacteroidales bacterium]
MNKTKIFIICFFAPFIVCSQSNYQNNNEDKSFELSKNLEIFSAVYRTLHTTYVDDIQSGDLVKTAIDAMLAKLDPYTNFFPEADMEDVKMQLLGQYGGIGALIHQKGDRVYISEPFEGLPAYEAGLKAGDEIIEVNGMNAKGKNSNQVTEVLRGQAGSDISIKIEREGKTMEVKFKRREIKFPNVPYYGVVRNNIGYIKLNEFTQEAGNHVAEAFRSLKSKDNISGLIIDLRGNGGGLLNEAVNIVNIFVEKGQPIVSTKGKLKERDQNFKTQMPPLDVNIPVVVLVDNYSASASEIVAGSLQDLDRAVIMGQRTFGKGLVQNVIPLLYNTQMKVTVSKYYIPSGRCIQAIDYSHRNIEGKAEKMPDSLRTAFKTKGGRTVYDGLGIEPDVSIESKWAPDIAIAIITKYLSFDYATEFVKKHPKIASAKDFTITDEIYNDFLNFIKDKDYSYKTDTERRLEDLRKEAEQEKFDKSTLEAIEHLQQRVKDDKADDLTKFKDDIKNILLSEIVVRYYNQKGRIESLLPYDKEVNQAIDLLLNAEAYKKILKP